MKDYSPITVTEVLSRKHFEQSRVIAGNDGLGRVVKWVHVVEVTNIPKLLNGHELYSNDRCILEGQRTQKRSENSVKKQKQECSVLM